MNMKEVVENIAKALVDHPEQVKVSEIEGKGKISVIELSVAKEDFGQVIGKEGRTAAAIRAILEAASRRLKRHYDLIIIE